MMFKPKIAQTDFEANMLPATRREVFWDVVKLHFPKLALCGMVSLLFTLPFLFTTMARDNLQASFYEISLSGSRDDETVLVYLTTYQNVIALVEVPCFLLLSVGLAGLARIVKRFAWEEPVRVGEDFIKGIAQNWKHYLLLGLLTGLANFACRYVGQIMGGFGEIFPVLLSVLTLGPLAAFLTAIIAVYDLHFSECLKYALLLYGKNAPKTLLTASICFLPFIPQMLPNIYCHTIGRLVSSLAIPFVMLAWFLFTFSCLDRNINRDRYPDLVDRGLLGKGA